MTGDTASVQELLRRLPEVQKPKTSVPAYTRYFNRPAGGLFAVLAFRIGLTPTHVTFLSALASLLGVAVLALVRPTLSAALLVTGCLCFGFVLDSADGQLARLGGGGTPAGEWLDHVLDVVKTGLLHMAVGVTLYRWTDIPVGWLLLPALFALTTSAHFFGMMLKGALMEKVTRADNLAQSFTRPAPGHARSLLLLPVDNGVLCLSFVLLPITSAFLSVYAGLFAFNALFAAYSLHKAYGMLLQVVVRNA